MSSPNTYVEDYNLVVMSKEEQMGVVGALTLGILVLMIFEVSTPEIVFLIALVAVTICQIIPLATTYSGFANDAVITIGSLFLVVGVVERSHVVDYFARKAFGTRGSTFMGALRMMLSSFTFSSVLNNTPLVALMIPVVRDWARLNNIPSSQLLMPLNFAIIAGGLLTMIGTSSSLTVQGLMQEDRGYQFNFFAPGAIALPCGIALIIYMAFASKYLLPKNSSGLIREARDKAKELVAEIQLSSDSVFVGKEIGQMMADIGVSRSLAIKIRRRVQTSKVPSVVVDNKAGGQEIVALDGIELNALGDEKSTHSATPDQISIARTHSSSTRVMDNKYFQRTRDLWGPSPPAETTPESDPSAENFDYIDIVTPSPHEVLHEGDTVFIASAQEVIVKLFKAIGSERKGIQILDSNVMDLPGFGSELVEVVISNENPFIGRFLGSCTEEFTAKYGLGVVSTRARQSGNDPENANFRDSKTHMISAGDVILCVCKTSDIAELKQNHDFLVVTVVGSIPHPVSWTSVIPIALFLLMIAVVAAEKITMGVAALSLSAIFFIGGWLKAVDIPKFLDIRLLMLLGCSLSFAKSLEMSGLSVEIASWINDANGGPLGSLFLVYFITLIITELISNNATAAIMYPIAVSLADKLGVSFKPFAMVVLISSSAAFMCPIGYQTHVMVWGVGGYRFMDFVIFGFIPNVIFIVGTCLLAPLVFPF